MKDTASIPGTRSLLRRRWPVIALLTGAWIFYAVALPEAPRLVGDSAGYLERASELAGPGASAAPFRLPAYPLLLLATGATGGSARLLFLVQLAAQLGAVALLAHLLARLGVMPRWRLAFVGIAVLPPLVQMSAFVLTESLTGVLLAAAVGATALWLAPGGSRGALAGAAAALVLLALTKPAMHLIGLAMAAPLLLAARGTPAPQRRRRLVAAVTVAVTPLLATGGMLAVNWARHGHADVALTGVHLATKMANYVEEIPDEHARVREILLRHRDAYLLSARHHDAADYIHRALPELRAEIESDPGRLSALLTRIHVDLIRREPRNYLREVFRSLGRYWLPYADEIGDFGSKALDAAWAALQLAVGALFWLVALGVAAASLLRCRMTARARERLDRELAEPAAAVPALGMAVAVALYIMAMSTAFAIGDPRYRMPTELLLLFVGILGLDMGRRAALRLSHVIEPDQENR